MGSYTSIPVKTQDVIDFFKSKGDETYNFMDIENCALAQYTKHIVGDDPTITSLDGGVLNSNVYRGDDHTRYKFGFLFNFAELIEGSFSKCVEALEIQVASGKWDPYGYRIEDGFKYD